MKTTRREFMRVVTGGLAGSIIVFSTGKAKGNRNDVKNPISNSGLQNLQWIDLSCSACGKPLSVFFHKDGSGRKTLGCMRCLKNPVIIHSDWNKVMKELGLVCNLKG